jgi:probable phosphoglycerate mutase
VVRDGESGQVLAERAEHIGVATNNVAEYRGLIAGLTAAREVDPDAAVEARLDSKLLVEQMSGRWKIKHPAMRPLAVQARAILPPEQVTYTWVPRELNKHADRLANEALDAAAKGLEWIARADTPEPVVDEAEVEPAPANALVGWSEGLGEPTTFVLLRHGETAHTAEKRFSGSGGADPALTPRGEEQARTAAAALAGVHVDAIVSSPVRRARQTADIVAASLGLPVREVPGLREADFGEWDGHTLAEVTARWPDQLAAWLSSTAVAPPGGESVEDVARRVAVARDQLLTRYAGRRVLVVTHVTPVKAFVVAALGAAMSAMSRMELRPASISVVDWYATGQAALRSFNETAHLPD